VWPAGRRARTQTDWLDSRHSFSFGPHYDPDNTHFGLLLVNNDDVVRTGTGFDTHPHRDMEIVTWVLDGSLAHQDSEGNAGVLYPGLAQRMSAGTGILHSERNDSPRHPARDVHFVQMWIVPDADGVRPSYEQRDVTEQLDAGELVVVASGMPQHRDQRVLEIHQRHAALHAARLAPSAGTRLPHSPFAHLFVARGSAELEGTGILSTGDAARVSVSEGQRILAGPDGAEVLIWEMDAALSAATP
jgi:redox-sensitive bicupin YhaK (pirin superfamily)